MTYPTSNPDTNQRVRRTSTGKTYVQTIDFVMGPQGYILEEHRTYIEGAPEPVLSLPELEAQKKLKEERKAKLEAEKAARQAKAEFNAMVSWSKTARENFKKWFIKADFSPITKDGNSLMPTLMFPDWVAGTWEHRRWVTYKKYLDALQEHAKRAWGEDYAMVLHTEFEVEHNQRPHFHPWMSVPVGLSSYVSGSKFADPKLNLQGRTFRRWLEAVWGYITDQVADLVEPRLTWVPSTAAELEKYAQDFDTPLKIMNYWLKEGKNPVMAEKRLQLRPPAAWIARGERFRWIVAYGIKLKFGSAEGISVAQEQHVRSVAMTEPNRVPKLVVEESGVVRDVARLSVDAKQGGKQICIVDDAKAALLLQPFELN